MVMLTKSLLVYLPVLFGFHVRQLIQGIRTRLALLEPVAIVRAAVPKIVRGFGNLHESGNHARTRWQLRLVRISAKLAPIDIRWRTIAAHLILLFTCAYGPTRMETAALYGARIGESGFHTSLDRVREGS